MKLRLDNLPAALKSQRETLTRFDLDDEDWPKLRSQLDQVAQVLATVKTRVAEKQK